MMSLFDVDEIQEMYVTSVRKEAETCKARKNQYRTAKRMLEQKKYSLEEIALIAELSLEEVKKIQGEM